MFLFIIFLCDMVRIPEILKMNLKKNAVLNKKPTELIENLKVYSKYNGNLKSNHMLT